MANSWAITGGNTPGYYAIDSLSGVITVTSVGIAALVGLSGVSNLTVTATNASGSGSGTATVNYAPPVPVVTNATFNLSTSGGLWVAGDVVGAMVASNSPTSWSITAGNTSGYYAISNTGTITVTAAGITGLGGQTGTSSLTCRAANAYGNGSGTATISYASTAPQVGWPNATNTGVPAGTVLTEYETPPSYNPQFRTPNVTVDSKILRGQVEIYATGVTFRNCLLQNPGYYGVIQYDDTGNNFRLEHCTVDMTGSSHCQALLVGGGPNATILACNIFGSVIAINLRGHCEVRDNYIHDLAEVDTDPAARHFDGFAWRGGSGPINPPIIVDHNWIVNPSGLGGTSPCFIKTENGGIVDGITVSNNYLGGSASATAYSENSTSIPRNVNFLNNTMERGVFGYFIITTNAGVAGYTICSGNVDAFTGANVDYQ